MNDRNFFAELKRRNVYKVAVAYAVVAWLLIQIATQVFPFFEIPNWAVRLVVLLLILGFPVALILSWVFEITPEGIKRESDVEPGKSIKPQTGRRIVGLTIVVAIIAAGLLALELLRSKSPATGGDYATGMKEFEVARNDLSAGLMLSPALLRLDPAWDPIRSDPRFQKLCEKKAK